MSMAGLKAKRRSQSFVPALTSFSTCLGSKGTWMALLVFIAAGRVTAADTNEIAQLQKRCVELIVNQFKLAEAKPVVEKLLALTLEQRGEYHQDTVVALHQTAFLAQQDGRYAEAERIWEKSLAIQEKLPTKDAEWFSRTLHMLAGAAQEQFDFPRAENLLQRALEIREKALGPDHPETANVVRTLARLSKQIGNFAQAELLFLRAVSAFERAGRHYESGLAETLAWLGHLYLDLGDFDKAEPLLVRALKLNEAVLGPEHPRTINSLNGLASIRRYQGNLTEAEALFQRSLRLREKLNGPDDVGLCWPLHHLAYIHLRLKRFSEAEAVLERMLAILRTRHGPAHPSLNGVLETLGQVHERRGDYPRARDCFEQALQVSERHLGPHDYSTTSYRRGLARIQFAMGDAAAALAAADAIQTGEEKRRAEVLSFTSERQRLVYLTRWASSDGNNLWATMGAVHPLARAIFRTKGLALDSLLEDRLLAEASSDPDIRRQSEILAQLKRRLAQFHFDDLAQENCSPATARRADTNATALCRQLETLEAELARKVIGLGRSRRALSVDVQQVRNTLPRDAVLLEFLHYRHYQGKDQPQKSYGALVVSHDAEPTWVPLGEAATIEKNLKLYQQLVRQKEDDGSLNQLLRELHQQLWAPLASALPAGCNEVIISPDAQLNFLSFATLLNSSNRFLGEEYWISYVSSGRDVLMEVEGAPVPPHLLVWTNPDFGAPVAGDSLDSPPASALRNIELRPLPGAESEGRLLHQRAADFGFTQSTLRSGPDATEAGLAQVQSPLVLHLATHGFVLPEPNPVRSLPLRGGTELDLPHSTGRITNPMLRCGLALAGAKRTFDAWKNGTAPPSANDGILTADEIGCLNLRGTRLAVLSACDTGMGEALAGEGVLGLRRGFVQAGTRNLLLTLWPIDDEATAGFMPEFYAAAHRTGDTARALASVQRAWLKKLRIETGTAAACKVAGPFILSFQGKPSSSVGEPFNPGLSVGVATDPAPAVN
jgi:CHAT domain-containing protein